MFSKKAIEKSKKKEYRILFVEEAIRNPAYKGWMTGRIEVMKPDDGSYSIDEVRFLTPRVKEWTKLLDEYDGKDVSEKELNEITKIVKEKFFQPL